MKEANSFESLSIKVIGGPFGGFFPKCIKLIPSVTDRALLVCALLAEFLSPLAAKPLEMTFISPSNCWCSRGSMGETLSSLQILSTNFAKWPRWISYSI